ncbi:hypothetical protein BH23ACT11_BH23ACT11_29120 [soil metagenome]
MAEDSPANRFASLKDASVDGAKFRATRRKARQATRRRRRRTKFVVAAALLVGAIAIILAVMPTEEIQVNTVAIPAASPPKAVPSAPENSAQFSAADTRPDKVDADLAGNPAALKKRIKKIAAYYGGNYGVIVSDPSSGEQVSLGSEETVFAASIGKLPTLLSLYNAADQGEVDLDDKITMLASDVQSYGTGELHTYPVGTTITLRECAFYLMNKSDNTAWVMLTRYLGRDRIQADLNGIGASDTGYWIPNTTTADDVLLMLKSIASPGQTSPGLSEEMLQSMTDTVFEDRIPGGLPSNARVAHKIGTYGNNFSDAGIVSYGDGDSDKRYFVVVFTEGLGESSARAAIQEISAAAYQTFGPAGDGS